MISATTRWSQPCMKHLVFSRPQTTARASPSTRALRCSAEDKFENQLRRLSTRSVNILEYSFCIHSVFEGQNIRCPCWTNQGVSMSDDWHQKFRRQNVSLTMADMESKNALSSSLNHSNLCLGLKKSLNGAIRSRSWA